MGEMRFTAFKENNTQSLDIGIGIEKDCKKNLRYVLKKKPLVSPITRSEHLTEEQK